MLINGTCFELFGASGQVPEPLSQLQKWTQRPAFCGWQCVIHGNIVEISWKYQTFNLQICHVPFLQVTALQFDDFFDTCEKVIACYS
jgi:hypothetical protein